MKNASIFFLSLLTVASASSYAQSADLTKFQFGIEAGSVAPSTPSNVAQMLVTRVGGVAVSSQDSSAAYGRIFGDLNMSENFGLELGYLGSGNLNSNFTGVSGGNIAYTGNVADAVSGFDYSVFIRPSKSTGWNSAFFKVGGTSYTLNETASISTGYGNAAGSQSLSGSGTFWSAGYDFTFNEKNAWRLAYSSFNNIAGQGANATALSVGYLIGF